ncbi:MAG: phosphatidylglycerol lysyltransferase domain-containing protein, partial [Candidatus Aminicenantes bacterium]|nr:phosphatidylglycerol lysyltransferase domain-containing protein [Candidatus Aminicenantes bacterium]
GNNIIEETIKICLSFVHRLSRVPKSFATRYCTKYRCEPDRNNFDYVYLSNDLIDLKGKKYDGKRNRINKFEKNNASKYFRLSREHLEDCRHLFEEWLKSKSPSNRLQGPGKDAILEALAYFEALKLMGGAVAVDRELAAFSIGEKLNADTAVIHIEIVSPAHDGLAQFINREFVKNECSGYKYINREQDIGLAGLRRAKMSYHPHHMVKKYDIRE